MLVILLLLVICYLSYKLYRKEFLKRLDLYKKLNVQWVGLVSYPFKNPRQTVLQCVRTLSGYFCEVFWFIVCLLTPITALLAMCYGVIKEVHNEN